MVSITKKLFVKISNKAHIIHFQTNYSLNSLQWKRCFLIAHTIDAFENIIVFEYI